MSRSAQRRDGGRRGTRPADRFVVRRPLRRGGQAQVDLAVRVSDRRQVAITTIHARGSDDRARLRREAEVLKRLADHPGIVNLIEDHSGQASPFIVLEYLPGGSLKSRLEGGEPIPARVEQRWIRQACRTVDVLSRHGIVHRDLGPANWLLTSRNGLLKPVDLGIASGRAMPDLTRTNLIVGRPGFLAPEQLKGGRATRQSDQWQLAHTLLQLLVRSPQQQPQFGGSLTGRGDGVDAAFARALDPDPRKRWPSSTAFGEAIIKALGGRDDGRRSRPGARRHRTAPPPRRPIKAGSKTRGRVLAPTRVMSRPANRGEPNRDITTIVALAIAATLLLALELLSLHR